MSKTQIRINPVTHAQEKSRDTFKTGVASAQRELFIKYYKDYKGYDNESKMAGYIIKVNESPLATLYFRVGRCQRKGNRK